MKTTKKSSPIDLNNPIMINGMLSIPFNTKLTKLSKADKSIIPTDWKYCSACKALHHKNDFGIDKNNTDGLSYYCKGKRNSYTKLPYKSSVKKNNIQTRVTVTSRTIDKSEGYSIRKYRTESLYDELVRRNYIVTITRTNG